MIEHLLTKGAMVTTFGPIWFALAIMGLAWGATRFFAFRASFYVAGYPNASSENDVFFAVVSIWLLLFSWKLYLGAVAGFYLAMMLWFYFGDDKGPYGRFLRFVEMRVARSKERDPKKRVELPLWLMLIV